MKRQSYDDNFLDHQHKKHTKRYRMLNVFITDKIDDGLENKIYPGDEMYKIQGRVLQTKISFYELDKCRPPNGRHPDDIKRLLERGA